MFNLIGSLTAAYTLAEYNNHESPRVGYLYYDHRTGKSYRFVKNTGSGSLAAQLVATTLTTSKGSWECELAAATDALRSFAGVRPVGATALAQNEFGYLQVGGPAVFTHSGGQATAAEEGIVTSASVAGKVEGEATGPFTIASHPGVFAVAEAAVSVLDTDVEGIITRCLFGMN